MKKSLFVFPLLLFGFLNTALAAELICVISGDEISGGRQVARSTLSSRGIASLHFEASANDEAGSLLEGQAQVGSNGIFYIRFMDKVTGVVVESHYMSPKNKDASLLIRQKDKANAMFNCLLN